MMIMWIMREKTDHVNLKQRQDTEIQKIDHEMQIITTKILATLTICSLMSCSFWTRVAFVS